MEKKMENEMETGIICVCRMFRKTKRQLMLAM